MNIPMIKMHLIKKGVIVKKCDLKRNFQFYNNNINYFKEYEENRWSKIKKNKDLLEKKRERNREYYLTIKDNY